jgi:hypothetical protein
MKGRKTSSWNSARTCALKVQDWLSFLHPKPFILNPKPETQSGLGNPGLPRLRKVLKPPGFPRTFVILSAVEHCSSMSAHVYARMSEDQAPNHLRRHWKVQEWVSVLGLRM